MAPSTTPTRELLTVATRIDRLRDDDLEEHARPQLEPGKLTASERDPQPLDARFKADPGKLRRSDVDETAMSPVQAIKYADWFGRTIDRRAETAIADEAGALATAFEFVETARDGHPLPPVLLARLTDELGVDLGAVRVHTDDRAAKAARALGARAFTVGDDIYFDAGAYDPSSESGLELIAHEVAHVAQQRRGVAQGARKISQPGDSHEQQAEAFARRFARSARADDPAELVNRTRAEGHRINLPFLDELESHFGTSFGGVEAYTGEAARLACQLMAAGAFAVRNIVALADPTPQRDLLIHELAHIVQMGAAATPIRFAAGSLRVGDRDSAAEHEAAAAVRGAAVVGHADPDVIHRGPPPNQTSGTQPAVDKGTKEERWAAFDKSITTKGVKNPPLYCDPANESTHYINTSAPFTLEDYRTGVKKESRFASLTDDVMANDLTDLHTKIPELCRIGSAGRKWAWILATETAGLANKVVQLVDDVKAQNKSSVSDIYETYCKALAHCVSLNPKPALTLKGQPSPQVTWSTTSGAQPVVPTDLDKCRDAFRPAIIGCTAYWLENDPKGEWGTFYTEVVNAKDKFPQKIVGDMFEAIATADLTKKGMHATKQGVTFAPDAKYPQLQTQSEYIGDGVVLEGSTLKVLDMKTGPETPGKVNDDGSGYNEEGMLAQAAAYAVIVKNELHSINTKTTQKQGPFKKCAYVFVTKDISGKWSEKLQKVFKGLGALDRLQIMPDPNAEGFAVLEFNPVFQVPLQDKKATTHSIANPPITHPGINFTQANIHTKEPGSGEVVGGDVTMEMDLAGGIKGEKVKKPIAAAAGVPAKVENKLDKLKVPGIDKFLKRIEPSARLTDTGVEATIKVLAGPSGIPNINLEESSITATYNASGELGITGEVKLAHTNKKITGEIKASYVAGQWGFEGSATVSEGMVEGLSGFTASVKYEGGHWSFGVDKVAYTKKLKAITLTGEALGVTYDVDKGTFSGRVNLDADLGMFGKAGATAEIKDNKLHKAELQYDSPELKYPAKSDNPTLKGTLGGTVTFADDKFSGSLRGTANLNVPALKKLAGENGIGLAVDAHVNPDGSYGGTIRTTTALQFGKYFEIPSLSCTIGDDGAVTGDFAVKIKNIKYLENAEVGCRIDKDGFKVVKADVHAAFGQPTDKMWGSIDVKYDEAAGLKITGTLNVKIKEGMVATGELTYNTEKNTIDTTLTIGEITLFDVSKTQSLFKFSKQFPLVSFYNIVGIYLDLGLDLDFDFKLKLGLKPTAKLEGLSLETWEYDKISAEIELLGQIAAELKATPKVGLGLFAISPSLLRGGGGIKVPITAKAELKPTGKVNVGYTPSGGVEGDAKLGMQLTFGIRGEVRPYAEASVLDGAWNPSWTGDALTEFEILPPKELFNFQLDLGGDLTPKEPQIPTTAEPPGAAPAGRQIPQEAPKTKQVGNNGPGKDATPPTSEPAGGAPDDSMFKMASLTGALKGLPGYATITGFMEKAGKVWDQIKGFFGRVAKAFKSFFQSIGNAIEEVLDGFAKEGLGYLPKLIKKIVGPTVWDIIEPIVNAAAGTAEQILELFETEPPKNAADFFPWGLKLMQRAFGVAFNSIGALISAIGTMVSRLGDLAKKIVTHMVQQGMIGVRRHQFYYWAFGDHYFLAADQYKIHLLGVNIDFRSSGSLLDLNNAVAFGLFQALEGMGVPPTNNAADPKAGDTYRDRWV